MIVTQILDPFTFQASAPKSSIWTVVIVMAILGAIGYYLYRKNQLELSNSGLL